MKEEKETILEEGGGVEEGQEEKEGEEMLGKK